MLNLSYKEPGYITRSITEHDYLLRLKNESFRSMVLKGEARILQIVGNSYGQPEQRRGPYPIYFSSHASHVAMVPAGGHCSIHLARRYLANIQENRYEIALVCADGDTKAAYLNDQSGIFELEIRLWSVKVKLWSDFFQWPRYGFKTTVHSFL